MSKEKQCCGNCGWAEKTPRKDLMECTFELPDSADKAMNYMFANEQGQTCPCWKPKEEKMPKSKQDRCCGTCRHWRRNAYTSGTCKHWRREDCSIGECHWEPACPLPKSYIGTNTVPVWHDDGKECECWKEKEDNDEG